VKWNALNSSFSQITVIITGLILMRLLSPADFGLIGMITVFTGFLGMLKDSGLGASLIYKQNLTQADKDTVFWFNVTVGFLLTISFYFCSGLIANYYEEPKLNTLVKAFSLTFAVSSLSQAHFTLLKKDMAFKQIFKVEFAGILVSTILTIVAAFYGLGVWSLVILHLGRSIIISINIWFFRNYTPSFKYSFELLKEHLKYSLPLLGTRSFNYWTRNADNFFIGKLLGSQALGFYSRAFFFVSMPTQKISSIIGGVIFPSLSKMQKDKKKSSELFLKAMQMTSFITFPLLGGLIVLAEPFVLTAFGEKWLPIVFTLQILSVLSMQESVFVYITPIFLAMGATKFMFRISVLLGITNIIVFYIGALHSIELVALLLVIVSSIYLFPKLYYVNRLINLKLILIFRALFNTFMLNLFSMFLIYIAIDYLDEKLISGILLLVGVMLYALIFYGLNFIFNKKQFKIFLNYSVNLIGS